MAHLLFLAARQLRLRRVAGIEYADVSTRRLFELHPEVQSLTTQQLGDFAQRLLADVFDLEEIVFFVANEIAQGADVGILQRVYRPHRQSGVVDGAVQHIAQPATLRAVVARRLAGYDWHLAEVDEAAALVHIQLARDIAVVLYGEEQLLGVLNRDRAVCLEVARIQRTRLFDLEAQHRLVDLWREHQRQLLETLDDLMYVLHDA